MTSHGTPVPFPLDGAQVSGSAAQVPVPDGLQEGLLLNLDRGSGRLPDSLDTLAKLAAETLSETTGGTVECAVVLHHGKHTTVAGTADRPRDLAALDRELGEGPLTDTLASGLPVAANHLPGDFRWPNYRRHPRSAGYRSILAVPLPLDGRAHGDRTQDGRAQDDGTQDGSVQSALAFFAARTAAFPQDATSAALGFADLAARSLRLVLELQEARETAADLRCALESRTSIDIACGVIMAQNRCSYREAFGIMSKASSHRNIKLRRVAEDILDKLPDGAPRTHFDH
jgi:hypothetical protein